MIEKINDAAKAKRLRGSCIHVASTAFPSTCVYFLQQEAQKTLWRAASDVKGRVRGHEGTFSGGRDSCVGQRETI